ncbi:MAG TPA: tRNA pseudouridine(55) synthase TruB [Kofleriaceae bacterium]|nr:tRNA pseudouridine(55) synthase TruB [Kofleriaceae bacterium]
MNGVLVVDKPVGLSSAAVVDKVKRAVRANRAGHGGTLDPLATGVLPVCLGAATKLAAYLLADDKAYEAEGILGVTTDTLDRTGAVTATHPVNVTREQLLAAMAARTGEQAQIPPMFSAIKQGGVRLYERARAGEEVERAPRRIRIDRLELLAFEPPRFRVAIECSKGTYVRSLVADLGADVGCGAHLSELRRTRSGRFSIAQAVPLDRVVAGDLDVAANLISLRDAVDLPAVTVGPEFLPVIKYGNMLPLERFGAEGLERFLLVDQAGQLLAICHADEGRIRYDRVIAESFTTA